MSIYRATLTRSISEWDITGLVLRCFLVSTFGGFHWGMQEVIEKGNLALNRLNAEWEMGGSFTCER